MITLLPSPIRLATPLGVLGVLLATSQAPAQSPYTVRHEPIVTLHVEVLDVGPEGTETLGSESLEISAAAGGSAKLDFRWGDDDRPARLELEGTGRPGNEDAPHALSVHAALSIGEERIVTNRDLEIRDGATGFMDIYEQERQRLVLVLRPEGSTRPRVKATVVQKVGAPMLLHVEVERAEGERFTPLETNDLHTFVGQSVEYSFQRGTGDTAESVRLALLPVRVMGGVTELEIVVTGSLPGNPDRLLLSRRETLLSNRGTVSRVTVTSGDPPAGYRFGITPSF